MSQKVWETSLCGVFACQSWPGLPTFAVQFPLPCLVVGVSCQGNDCKLSIHCEELTDTFGVFLNLHSIDVLL